MIIEVSASLKSSAVLAFKCKSSVTRDISIQFRTRIITTASAPNWNKIIENTSRVIMLSLKDNSYALKVPASPGIIRAITPQKEG